MMSILCVLQIAAGISRFAAEIDLPSMLSRRIRIGRMSRKTWFAPRCLRSVPGSTVLPNLASR